MTDSSAIAVLKNFEITGPDGDNLIWLVLHGNGCNGKGMVNLGTPDQIVGKVALLLEEDRKRALALSEQPLKCIHAWAIEGEHWVCAYCGETREIERPNV